MALSVSRWRSVRRTGRSKPLRLKYRAHVPQRPFVVARRSEHTRQSVGTAPVVARDRFLGDAVGIAEALGNILDAALGIGKGCCESTNVVFETPHMVIGESTHSMSRLG